MTVRAPRTAPRPLSLARALERSWDELDTADGVPRALWDAALCSPLSDFARRPAGELRSALCRLGWILGGGRGEPPDAVALVIEGLHAGSLIVDDLEDDARERRGAPALHVVHGAPTALNAGNWLYFWALARIAEIPALPARQLHMHRRVIDSLVACHNGQALDLGARPDELERAELPAVCAAITRGKTATLAGLALELGALAAGASPIKVAELGRLGAAIGTALQMSDDLGGLGAERRDKGREDLRAARVTWPWAWLAEHADAAVTDRLRGRLRAATDDAALDALADALHAEVAEVGRRAIAAQLAEAQAIATGCARDPAELRILAELRAALETRYGV